MSKPRTPKQISQDIEATRRRIGKERDKLRELADEAEALIDSCDRADEGMKCAVEALSELA